MAGEAGTGGADDQHLCRMGACVQVAALVQGQPADGFGFDFGELAPEVGFDVGRVCGAGDGLHGNEGGGLGTVVEIWLHCIDDGLW